MYWSRVNRRGRRFLASVSSYSGSGTREENAIVLPFGDHTGSETLSFMDVSRSASPPASGMT